MWETIWPFVVAATPGTVGLGWKMVEYFRRETHERELETLKAQLRRELESDLKEHESRLRVQAEINLKLHQRSWDLLREVQAAGLASFQATRDFAISAMYSKHEQDGTKRRQEAYDRALACMSQLSGLSRCVPPAHSAVKEATSQLNKAFNRVAAFMFEPAGPPYDAWWNELNTTLRDGLAALIVAVDAWNQQLWTAQEGAAKQLSPPDS